MEKEKNQSASILCSAERNAPVVTTQYILIHTPDVLLHVHTASQMKNRIKTLSLPPKAVLMH